MMADFRDFAEGRKTSDIPEMKYAVALYRKVLDTERGPLAVCPGTCERDGRPLACRMFPLLPVIREAGTAAETDLRAGTVCPLARQGIRAMDPAFVEAVKEAGALLAADPAQRAFLERLAAEQEELRQMKREWRGKHV